GRGPAIRRRSREGSVAYGPLQPRPYARPVPLHRPQRGRERVRRLLLAEAGEDAAFDDPHQSLIDSRKVAQGEVERQHLARLIVSGGTFFQLNAGQAAAALERAPLAGV